MEESNNRDSIEPLDCQKLGELLIVKGVHEDVVSRFVTNRVDGSTFLKLSEDDIKELIPTIGDHVIVREMVKDANKLIYFLASASVIPRVAMHVYDT